MAPRKSYELFAAPALPAQRQYEAMRAYFLEGLSAAQVAERHGYSPASVATMASRVRKGGLGELFSSSRPGPRRQPKKDAARELVVRLRQQRHGLQEIVAELERAGTPLSRTAVWEILREEGMARIARPMREEPVPAQLERAPKVRVLDEDSWPLGSMQTDHAGLFLLLPQLVDLDLPALVRAAGWPSTSQLDALHSVLSLLALKLCGRRRRSHVSHVVHDQALGLFAGLNVLPKVWHLTTYGYRTTREHQQALFAALQPRLRAAGLLGDAGLNLDFHAIMSYADEPGVLEKHYVPRRSQRTRSVLTFLAQDSEHHTIVYANADLTAREYSGEVIAFCRFFEKAHGELPRLLAFDSKLTTHEHLAELDQMGVGFITLRQRPPKLMAELAGLPGSDWTRTRLDRAGKHKNARYHEMTATIAGRDLRQLAIDGLGREHPTLLLTNQHHMTPKQLIERYGQRWGIENQLAEQIRAFHLDSLCSQVPLGVDFDVCLTVLADIIYRRFARSLPAVYHRQTPDTLRSQLTDGVGTIDITDQHIRVNLKRRAHTPALLNAGYHNKQIQIPWWNNRTLSYHFPA